VITGVFDPTLMVSNLLAKPPDSLLDFALCGVQVPGQETGMLAARLRYLEGVAGCGRFARALSGPCKRYVAV
jgi:hypothetical protein